jgi:hypothetical protein
MECSLKLKFTFCYVETANVVAEWLTLQLRIREVPDLNIGLETG